MRKIFVRIEKVLASYVAMYVLPIEVLLLSIIPNKVLGGITLITAGLVLIACVSTFLRVLRYVDADLDAATRSAEESNKLWNY